MGFLPSFWKASALWRKDKVEQKALSQTFDAGEQILQSRSDKQCFHFSSLLKVLLWDSIWKTFPSDLCGLGTLKKCGPVGIFFMALWGSSSERTVFLTEAPLSWLIANSKTNWICMSSTLSSHSRTTNACFKGSLLQNFPTQKTGPEFRRPWAQRKSELMPCMSMLQLRSPFVENIIMWHLVPINHSRGPLKLDENRYYRREKWFWDYEQRSKGKILRSDAILGPRTWIM